ncbi:hypothetical protein CB1_000951021 [Camelus ferus]|nr:hypothetical protein CB1_000951021 [Camelus ferus]
MRKKLKQYGGTTIRFKNSATRKQACERRLCVRRGHSAAAVPGPEEYKSGCLHSPWKNIQNLSSQLQVRKKKTGRVKLEEDPNGEDGSSILCNLLPDPEVFRLHFRQLEDRGFLGPRKLRARFQNFAV